MLKSHNVVQLLYMPAYFVKYRFSSCDFKLVHCDHRNEMDRDESPSIFRAIIVQLYVAVSSF
jgi:hypothetical protein